jgi:tRNA threonylcarbamoyladenosine biosynthesis protein TsaB
MILAIRTDKPEAELYLYDTDKLIDSISWHAHRELSDTLLTKIDELLGANKITKSELSGAIVYQGPGSFTGLRIGITVANTLAYSLGIPITGAEGEQWANLALDSLKSQSTSQVVVPEYGSEAHITKPRK